MEQDVYKRQGNKYSRRDMGDAYGALGSIDALAARTRGAE